MLIIRNLNLYPIQIQPYEGIFLSGSAASDIFTAGVPSFSILALKLCFDGNS